MPKVVLPSDLSPQARTISCLRLTISTVRHTTRTGCLRYMMVVTPHPKPDWSQDSDKHPGFLLKGVDNTPGRKAYYIHLQAKPGKAEQVKAFLRDINAGVNQEPGTGPWFALQYSETTFGIFEAFPDVAGRNDHNVGPGGVNFKRSAELHEMLEYPAHIYRLDVMHGKFDTLFGEKVGPLAESSSTWLGPKKAAL